jgi:hypothetical protein
MTGTGVSLCKFQSSLPTKLVTAIESYGDFFELCISTFHIGYAAF